MNSAVARALCSPPWPGIGAYLALTFVFSWVSILLLDRAWEVVWRTFPTRLLAASFFYCLTMGWQPFLAVLVVRRWIDPPGLLDFGLNPTRRGVLLLGGLAAVSVAAMAMLVTWLAQLLGVVSVVAVPSVERQVPDRQSLEALAILGAAFAGTVVLLCVQAFTEELGWRGYFLPRMMQSLGPWRGLLIHGLVWGTWYAPVVALAAEGSASAAIRGGTFVVTCTLLGILLGWLRLLARSLSLAVVFNAVLTVSAGLPFILRGVDVGSRGSAYGPAGWIPLLLAAAVLFSGPARRAVTTPRAVDAHPRGPGSVRRFVESLISRNGHHTR